MSSLIPEDVGAPPNLPGGEELENYIYKKIFLANENLMMHELAHFQIN